MEALSQHVFGRFCVHLLSCPRLVLPTACKTLLPGQLQGSGSRKHPLGKHCAGRCTGYRSSSPASLDFLGSGLLVEAGHLNLKLGDVPELPQNPLRP